MNLLQVRNLVLLLSILIFITQQIEEAISSEILWRVVTRSIMVKSAADNFRARLLHQGLKPTLITHREPVSLYAFDDPRQFKNNAELKQAIESWQRHGIEAHAIRNQGYAYIELGRFSIREYAIEQQNKLKNSKKKYVYAKRILSIPVYRFTFPASIKDHAMALWKQLNNLGLADPVLIKDLEFKHLYGDALLSK